MNSRVAMHRDVNLRNIIINHRPARSSSKEDFGGGGKYTDDASSASSIVDSERDVFEFGLIDFGSAVDMKQWEGDGEGSWRTTDPTGDAKYWSPASWVRFLF